VAGQLVQTQGFRVADPCFGLVGPGPNQVNWMAALERWRESGVAPDRIDAVRIGNNRVEVSRPLCAYPQVAVYNGKGTTNDAGNFSCKNP